MTRSSKTKTRVEEFGGATLYLGDNQTVVEEFGAKARFDVTITDPPYDVGAAEWDKWQGLKWLEDARKRTDTVMITTGVASLFRYPAPDWVGCYSYALAKKRALGGKGRLNAWEPVLIYGHNTLPIDHKHFPPLSEPRIDHPTAKPIAPFLWLVRAGTQMADVVFDPFMGSGTTGVACLMTGRRFVGIEADQKYFDLACKRMEDALRRPGFFGGVRRTGKAPKLVSRKKVKAPVRKVA